jgi:hypothetical protein
LGIEHRALSIEIPLDIWLRGTSEATTQTIAPVERQPSAWTDADVARVLTGMLRAIDRASNPDADPDRHVSLRGFSWIVNPFENGGVLIALELTLGAVIAGPFDIAEARLSEMIARVIAADRIAAAPAAPGETIH